MLTSTALLSVLLARQQLVPAPRVPLNQRLSSLARALGGRVCLTLPSDETVRNTIEQNPTPLQSWEQVAMTCGLVPSEVPGALVFVPAAASDRQKLDSKLLSYFRDLSPEAMKRLSKGHFLVSEMPSDLRYHLASKMPRAMAGGLETPGARVRLMPGVTLGFRDPATGLRARVNSTEPEGGGVRISEVPEKIRRAAEPQPAPKFQESKGPMDLGTGRVYSLSEIVKVAEKQLSRRYAVDPRISEVETFWSGKWDQASFEGALLAISTVPKISRTIDDGRSGFSPTLFPQVMGQASPAFQQVLQSGTMTMQSLRDALPGLRGVSDVPPSAVVNVAPKLMLEVSSVIGRQGKGTIFSTYAFPL